jgi:hypothetical protein
MSLERYVEESGLRQSRTEGVNHAGSVASHDVELLPAVWMARAALFRLHGAEAQAATLDATAAELEAVLFAKQAEILTVAAASAESGYSPSQIRRMLREGKIRNAGDPGSPRIRRADLPRKPGHHVDVAPSAGLSSKRQIARAVAAER